MEVKAYSNTYDKLVENDDDIVGMVAYAMYRAEKNKLIKKSTNSNLSSEEKEKLDIEISNFSTQIDAKKLKKYKDNAEKALEASKEEEINEITSGIFSAISESYKKESRTTLVGLFLTILVFIILLSVYIYKHDSLYTKDLSFVNGYEILFYLFERFSTKVFIVGGLVSLIVYLVKLFTHAYSNHQDIHNILANRIYLENSGLFDNDLEKFQDFTLIKIQNDSLKSQKLHKGFLSIKTLGKIKSLLISDEKK
ncbi:MAG: hypothetical protein EAZ53_12820 [Bacteroidetes bacterium]|nr:MAG: hypothetical protein EAZ53_12820 [Bacteroidota bacterium]